MFGDNTTKRLVAIENEQRAQKMSSPLNYGALVKSSSTPTQTYNGTVTNSIDPATGINARWIATFTRSDGIAKPPLVDFPWDYTLDLYQYTDFIAAGYITSATGRDRQAVDQLKINSGFYEVGSNYVKWKIEIAGNNGTWFYVSSNGTGVHLTVQAVSMVPGNLTLVRVV